MNPLFDMMGVKAEPIYIMSEELAWMCKSPKGINPKLENSTEGSKLDDFHPAVIMV